MSDQDPSVTIAALQVISANDRIANASLALVVYEYLITLEHEWDSIRARHWSAVTWLFLVNRYLMVAVAIVTVLPTNAQTRQNVALTTFIAILTLLPFAVTAGFSALRTFAVMGRNNLIIPSIVLFLGLIPVATNSYVISHITPVYVNDSTIGPTCSLGSDIAPLSLSVLSSISRLAVAIADIVVWIVTWMKTFRSVRLAGSVGTRTISQILLQDGTIYFVVLLAMNILLWVANLDASVFSVAEIAELITVLQPLLLSRFLINLRQVNSTSSGDSSPYVSDVGFARKSVIEIVVGNMGEALDDGLHDPLLQRGLDRDLINDNTADEEVIYDIIHLVDMNTENT